MKAEKEFFFILHQSDFILSTSPLTRHDNIEFNGPMIEWKNIYECGTTDVLELLSGGNFKGPKTDKNPAYNFLNSEFSKQDKSRNFSDSLLDNVDFRKYYGPLLERFRITFFADEYTPVALEIGKYRPGKYQLIIIYYLCNVFDKDFKTVKYGLNYHFLDTVSSENSTLCSRIIANARNLHPIDTGQEMNCYHQIEYYCAIPNFSTYFNVNCAKVRDNINYLQLLSYCADLIKCHISEKQLKESRVIDYIENVTYWDSLFNKEQINEKPVKTKWTFYDSKR